MIDIDALEALERAATPGPWTATNRVRDDGVWMVERDGDDLIADIDGDNHECDAANAALIAAARNALPELIAEVRRHRALADDRSKCPACMGHECWRDDP